MNIALIGLGMVAETHLRAIAALGDQARLVGVLSGSTASAAAFIAKHDDLFVEPPEIYADVAAVAQDARVDVAVICTPPNARADLVGPLAAAGKHILMEKPIERTLPGAKALVEVCEGHGVALGLFFQHRKRASALALADALAQDALGALALVEIAVPWWRDQAYYDAPGRGSYARDGGGVLISQAIHTLDLALNLAGPVTRVQAMARRTALHDLEAEDFVSAGLEFASGAVGSLVASTASYPGGTESITLHGTKGSAVLRGGALGLALQDGTTRQLGEDAGSGGGADPMAFTHAWHQGIYADFLGALAAGRTPTTATGREGLKVHALIEALIRSSDTGRIVDVYPTE